MTEREEQGSDEQMGEERLAMIRGKLDLEIAEMVEEERKVQAQPVEDDRPG